MNQNQLRLQRFGWEYEQNKQSADEARAAKDLEAMAPEDLLVLAQQHLVQPFLGMFVKDGLKSKLVRGALIDAVRSERRTKPRRLNFDPYKD